jgi:lipopolysaccharide/colanic/teichoic acid biosynthesis glycosyltransferase
MATHRNSLPPHPISPLGRAAKRAVDLSFAIVGILALGWLMVAAWLVATIDTGRNGLFMQDRIGRDGRTFRVIKIRTMRVSREITTTVTTSTDARITPIGRLLRLSRIDELPQLVNVLVGDMSLVGPRPDVPGWADRLEGDDRVILRIRPGITGPATLHFRDEAQLLARQPDPERFNREVIWPAKVRLNREYLQQWSLAGDFRLIARTLIPGRAGSGGSTR